MAERIAAIITTLDRLDELRAGIAALSAQTRPPDEIIVVDNGSSDGTAEWLASQPHIITIRSENRGAGAAFGLGLRTAVERGFDWSWCFDDDAHPTPGALEALCRATSARPDVRVFNSVSLARNDPAHFAVGALWVRVRPDDYLFGQLVTTPAGLAPYTDANGMVDSLGGHFYHGTLIHRRIVETVGSQLAWLFVRGEEVEYGLRMMRAGYHIYSVVSSIVYHPAMSYLPVRLLGKFKSFETMSPQKRYYSVRNAIWIRRSYYAAYPLVPYLSRRLAGAWFTELFLVRGKPWRERLAACDAALRGVVDGLRFETTPHE